MTVPQLCTYRCIFFCTRIWPPFWHDVTEFRTSGVGNSGNSCKSAALSGFYSSFAFTLRTLRFIRVWPSYCRLMARERALEADVRSSPLGTISYQVYLSVRRKLYLYCKLPYKRHHVPGTARSNRTRAAAHTGRKKVGYYSTKNRTALRVARLMLMCVMHQKPL